MVCSFTLSENCPQAHPPQQIPLEAAVHRLLEHLPAPLQALLLLSQDRPLAIRQTHNPVAVFLGPANQQVITVNIFVLFLPPHCTSLDESAFQTVEPEFLLHPIWFRRVSFTALELDRKSHDVLRYKVHQDYRPQCRNCLRSGAGFLAHVR